MDDRTNDWDAALQRQDEEARIAADAEAQRYGEQVMSDFDNLVTKGNQQRAESRRMKDATLSALILQARGNNGFVPADVLDAASANMGFRVAGGNFDKNGNFFLYTQDGQSGQLVPMAMASPEMQYRTLDRAKMGVDYRREIYGGMARRLTPAQLTQMGILNPDVPSATGTTVGGGTARRVFGFGGPERRGVSAFSADGRGGFSRMDMGADGVVNREDMGTRDPNSAGQWRQISVGADPDDRTYDENGNEVHNPNPRQIRRYENSKTGEVVSVRDGETPPWQTSRAPGKGVEIARINAASREKVADANNRTKLDVAKLSADNRKEIADAANILKKYGIDVGFQKALEGYASNESIADKREKGRQARAILRDSQAWGRLAIEQAKVDNNLAVQMKKADTYGKRVDLIEQKIKNDYEIQMKRAKTDEERQKAEETYKERKADIEEGNLDLGWFKAETAADLGQQKLDNTKDDKAADRKLKRELAELRARAQRDVLAGDRGTSADALKRIIQLQEELEGGKKDTGDKATTDEVKKISSDLGVEPGNEPPNGEHKVVKDGISYHWGKSKSGKWGYFPDK